MRNARDSLVGSTAPELIGSEWLNSRPLTLAELRKSGQTTLVVFWTYSCVNCLRTLPTIKHWWEQYRHQGLMIIGVHSPEFAFEKESVNLEHAVQDLGIGWPVLNDRDHATWNAYANHYWPRHILIDASGTVVHDHIGQGGYEATEEAIQALLIKHGATNLPAITPADHQHKLGDVCYAANPETYLGSTRGMLKNHQAKNPVSGTTFIDPRDIRKPGVALHGEWIVLPESIQHSSSRQSTRGYISLVFSGVEVNLVASATDDRILELVVELDGKPIPIDQRGGDIIEQSGQTVVRIQESKLYRLIKSATYLSPAELRLIDESGRFQAYAFTFSGCLED